MNEKMQDLIDDYNLGKLPPPVLEKFEAAMAEDAGLKRAVAEHRLEWEARELLAENLLRGQIRQNFQVRQPVKLHFLQNNRAWLMAAAAAVLGAACILFFQKKQSAHQPIASLPNEVLPQKQQQPNVPIAQTPPVETPVLPKENRPRPQSPQPEKRPNLRQIAMASYQIPEGLSGIRGGDDADTLQLAGKAFSEKNYRQVVELLSVLPENDRQMALLLRAHAHFLMGEYAGAAADFAQLETGGMFGRDAQWFGLLAKMSIDGADKNALKTQLDAIRQNPKNRFQKDAAALWVQVFGG